MDRVWGSVPGNLSWVCLGFDHVHGEIVLLEPPGGSGHDVDGQADWEERQDITDDRWADQEFRGQYHLFRLISVFLKHGLMSGRSRDRHCVGCDELCCPVKGDGHTGRLGVERNVLSLSMEDKPTSLQYQQPWDDAQHCPSDFPITWYAYWVLIRHL